MEKNIHPEDQDRNPDPWQSMGDLSAFSPGGMNLAGVLAAISRYVSGLPFPAGKQTLLARAKGQGAPDPVLRLLQGLEERTYSSPEDVAREVGKS